MHLIKQTYDENAIECGSIGGQIILEKEQSIPKCATCNNAMVQYFAIDIKPEFNSPFKTGSRLSMFCCPEHDDTALEQYSGRDTQVQPSFDTQVHVHYSIVFNTPDSQTQILGKEPRLIEKTLYAQESPEEIEENEHVGIQSKCYESKIGGEASWLNYSVNLKCNCGGKLAFVCQLKDCYDFFHGEGSSDYYTLLNGNFIFILACENQCSPYAVIPVCDN